MVSDAVYKVEIMNKMESELSRKIAGGWRAVDYNIIIIHRCI